LNAIRVRAAQLTSQKIVSDISQALVEAEMIPADEQARLESELDSILTD